MRNADDMRIKSGVATEVETTRIYERMVAQIDKDFDMIPKTNRFMSWSLERNQSQSYAQAITMVIGKLERNGFKVTHERETFGDFREPMDCGQSERLLIEW